MEKTLVRSREFANIALIDGQNLYLGTKKAGWIVDYRKLRVYLRDKYHIGEAHYFLGYRSGNYEGMYAKLEQSGFTLSFREHSGELRGNKKGNVDCDIVFNAMKRLVEKEEFGKIFLISGDGDYKRLVDFLIEKGRFGKMLFPNMQFTSSLYMNLRRGNEHFDYLEKREIRSKIEFFRK